MTDLVEGRSPVTADAAQAHAVLATLGYEPAPNRQVPGPLTKAVVLLLCVIAITAAIWFGGPLTPSSAVRGDPTRASAPVPNRAADPLVSDEQSSVTEPSGDVAVASPRDRPLPPEPRNSSELVERLPRAQGVLLPAELAESVDVRPGWRLRWDGDDPAWLPGVALSLEPGPAADRVAAETGAALPDDDFLDRLIQLSVDDLRGSDPSSDPVGLIGESSPSPAPAVAPSVPPPAPPLVSRSARVRARPLEPPEPPPPASAAGREMPSSPGLAQALREQEAGDFAGARRRYLAVIAQNDRNAEAHNNLGVLYQEHGDRDEAVREFERAIAIAPQSVKAHNNLGVALLEAGSWDAAAREFRTALAAGPSNLESMINLALALDALGQHAEAIEALHDALAIDPGSAEAHYNLAFLFDRHGEAQLALEHYRSFLEHDDQRHPELAHEVARRIEQLARTAPRG